MEPLTITLECKHDFDGITPIDKMRDDFAASMNGRHHHLTLAGPAGVIRTDFFNFFAEGSPKVLGVAGSTHNPLNKARLYRDAPIALVRQEIELTPRVQHMLVTPGDMLAVLTRDQGPVFLTLTVEELSESQHLELAAMQRPESPARRFRLYRNDATGFQHAPNAETWHPSFTWYHATQRLEVVDNGIGPLPIRDLWQGSRTAGCYVSVRYSNMGAGGTGKVWIIEQVTRSARLAQDGLTNVEWSRPQFYSPGDLLGLEAAAAADTLLVADIELTPVPRAGRLSGRYDRGL